MTDMLQQPTAASEERKVARGGVLYRVIWKWHFLAGLLVLPFMAFMAVTGIINLFHDDLTEALYAKMLNVSQGEQRLDYEVIARAVSLAVPGRISKVFIPEIL